MPEYRGVLPETLTAFRRDYAEILRCRPPRRRFFIRSGHKPAAAGVKDYSLRLRSSLPEEPDDHEPPLADFNY